MKMVTSLFSKESNNNMFSDTTIILTVCTHGQQP